MIKIRVPATTANIGAGFDCAGMALKLYNTVWAEERESGLVVENPRNPDMPRDESNLIYTCYRRYFDETGYRQPGGLYIRQEDEIPPAKGLGSSAACAAAGLLAADALNKAGGGNGLALGEIINIAAAIEGHPDNTTPALAGGLCVCAEGGGKTEYIKINTKRFIEDGLKFAALIPGFILPTTEARAVLPESYSRKDCVFNITRIAVTTAAFISGDYDKLRIGIDDRLHQQYRARLIPDMPAIFDFANRAGAVASFLNGAGPTLMMVYKEEETGEAVKGFLGTLGGGWRFTPLEPDETGAVFG